MKAAVEHDIAVWEGEGGALDERPGITSPEMTATAKPTACATPAKTQTTSSPARVTPLELPKTYRAVSVS